MLQGSLKHLKITPKLNNMQIFVFILGRPGEAYVESRGTLLKCHEDLITLDTYVQQGKTIDNKFDIYVKTLTSLAKWGPGGFNNQTGPILVHIYPPFNNHLHVKYRSNLIIFRGHVGPLHKIQGYQGHQNVSKCRPHHSGDIHVCTTRGNNLKTIFSFMGQNVKKIICWGYFGGPEGVFNDQTKPILLSSYPLTHIDVHVK